MAKKSTPAKVTAKSKKPAPVVAKKSAVRNTGIPKIAVQKAANVISPTPAMIAERAYQIWESGVGGSEHDHWIRAENELRSGL